MLASLGKCAASQATRRRRWLGSPADFVSSSRGAAVHIGWPVSAKVLEARWRPSATLTNGRRRFPATAARPGCVPFRRVRPGRSPPRDRGRGGGSGPDRAGYRNFLADVFQIAPREPAEPWLSLSGASNTFRDRRFRSAPAARALSTVHGELVVFANDKPDGTPPGNNRGAVTLFSPARRRRPGRRG